MGVMDAPLGYAVEGRFSPKTEFLLGGAPGDLGPAGNMTIRAGSDHFEQDWPLAGGGAVHISEDIAPYSILLGGDASYDKLIAAIHTRTKWQEATALGGRVNVLKTTIGRLTISIEGPLSHDDLFRIAESLQPAFAPLL